MKVLIFDAGSLITLSMNCLLSIIEELKKKYEGKFIITKEVEQEAIKTPMAIKKYKLGAIRIKELVDKGILEFPERAGVKDFTIESRMHEILKTANSLFVAGNREIHIIDRGEASCLALSKCLSEKDIENLIVIDERTTRMLCEDPEKLRVLLESKLHTRILTKFSPDKFRNIKFIRSSELIYVAFKKGAVKNQSKEFLDAMLYSAKFKGCAISNSEIMEIERL